MNFLKTILLLICVVFFSCHNEKKVKAEQNRKNTEDKYFEMSLKYGTFFELSQNKYISIYDGTLYFISNNTTLVGDKYKFKFLKGDKVISTFDLTMKNPLKFNKYKNLQVFKNEMFDEEFETLTIEKSEKKIKDNEENLFKKKINYRDIINQNHYYVNQLNKNENLVEKMFSYSLLKNGSFFKNESGLFILLDYNYIYIISFAKRKLNHNFMLHFLEVNKGFLNKDFFFENKEITSLLGDKRYKNIRVARVKISDMNFTKYPRIRIGEYFRDSGGKATNLWVEILDIQEILDNDLLIYNKEFDEQKKN